MEDPQKKTPEEGTLGKARKEGGAPRVPSVARLSNGVTLPYVAQGRPDGVALVMLHGLGDSWRSFEPVLPHLSDDVRAFALTLRGHGDADRPAGDYRPEDMADDVAEWMNSIGLGAAVVVGHSMGAHVAQRFAIDHPDRTRALVLIGAFREFGEHPVIRELWADVSRLSDPVDAKFARAFQESTLSRPVATTFLDAVVSESLAVPARVWKAALRGLMQSDLRAERGRITAPTLLVWGSEDAMVAREEQDDLLRAIAGSALLEYPGVGHAVHWHEPKRFAEDLMAFVRRS